MSRKVVKKMGVFNVYNSFFGSNEDEAEGEILDKESQENSEKTEEKDEKVGKKIILDRSALSATFEINFVQVPVLIPNESAAMNLVFTECKVEKWLEKKICNAKLEFRGPLCTDKTTSSDASDDLSWKEVSIKTWASLKLDFLSRSAFVSITGVRVKDGFAGLWNDIVGNESVVFFGGAKVPLKYGFDEKNKGAFRVPIISAKKKRIGFLVGKLKIEGKKK